MIDDNYIVKTLFTSSGKRIVSGFNKIIENNQNIKEYLDGRYIDYDSYAEILWRIKLNIEIRPTCKQCGSRVKYYKAGKFSDFCSVKCAMNSDKVKQHCKELLQKKYGVDNVYQLESIKAKIRKTNMERYGVVNYLISEECKLKSKHTSLERYGTEYPSQSKEFKEKVKTTNKIKYGCDYGLQNKDIRAKGIKTCQEKYGCNYFSESKEFKELFNDKEFVRQSKIKEYSTRKLKNSGHDFNTSKPEQLLYNYIKSCYPDMIYQYYTDERYPFNCDFYIPSLDLFIEYNGHWTHNSHIFNKDDENDMMILNNINEKSLTSKFYKNYKYVWSEKDPLKYKTAKENNLNYLIIWNHEFNLKKQDYDFVDKQIKRFKK